MIRDVIQAGDLSFFAEFGIVLFVLAFLLILVNALFGLRPEALAKLSNLPLVADAPEPPSDPEPTPSHEADRG